MLESLRAIGELRALPRLQVGALFELVRLHARRGRSDTARRLSAQLDTLVLAAHAHTPKLFLPWVYVRVKLARAYAGLTNDDSTQLTSALEAAQSAAATSATLRLGSEAVEAQFIRAALLEQKGLPEMRGTR
jgi:LuxR family maltose regulon positive regulatory protein